MPLKNTQPAIHHIEIKKHHKWILGSLTSLLLIAVIANSILLYFLYGQVEIGYTQLSSDLKNLETDTNAKLTELTDSVISTKQDISFLETNLNEELSLLKASVGTDFSGIIDLVVPSVVTIRTDISQGTGFIITSDGYIVTNYHVMEGAKAAGVYTYDGKQHQVSPKGYNKDLDIALLKIEGVYDEIELEDSDNVQVGEKVIAIGNPLGLQFSVSEGIVSAIHREGPNGLEAYIQTDAALNPGNSGGPLINKQGKVVGINNFKISSGESLGFALESDYIKSTVNSISQQALNQTLI
ncbi:MAG: trypsin-like peptidase domain-containing protein [Candidatus Pacearchaeota archaeon]